MRHDWRTYVLIGIGVGLVIDAIWIPLMIRLGLITQLPFGVICGLQV